MTKVGTQNNLMRRIFDLIPTYGIYESDLRTKLAGYYANPSVEQAIAYMLDRKYIKKAGCKDRPIYVRMEPRRVVFQNIKPLPPGAEVTLLQMHINFEEKRL